MNAIPVDHALMVSAMLFVLGTAGLLLRRNIVFILMSLEIVLNACGLAFVVAGARWEQADGQVFFIMVLTLAAAEVAIALALMLQVFRRFRTLDMDRVRGMWG
jgi:NADH-quinone oxidoreductase subunit K